MKKARALPIQDILVLVLSLCVTYFTFSVSITDVFHSKYAINHQF